MRRRDRNIMGRKRNTEGEVRSSRVSAYSQNQANFGTLVGSMAHDLANLVTLIAGHAELLAAHPELDLRGQSDAASIRHAARRAIHLVSRWSDFHRPKTGLTGFVSLRSLFADLHALARPSLGIDVQLDVSLEPRELAVVADAEHLERALLPLILNARDAIEARGSIRLHAATMPRGRDPHGGVVITVEDDGAGMSQSMISRIFEPFFTTKARGTGLGLPGVRDFVEQNQGSLHVQSHVGKGTTFRLELARAREHELAEAVSVRPAPSRGETLLLVTSNRETLDCLERLLEQCGYRVLVAAGAGEALLTLERSTIPLDAIVVDSELLHMSHQELTARIRALDPTLPLLLLAGTQSTSDPSVDAILAKPFDAKNLPLQIERLIDIDSDWRGRSQTLRKLETTDGAGQDDVLERAAEG